jgi:hypothetical protein
MAKKAPNDVLIGKFDLLATFTYAKGLLEGLGDDEARERGMVAAVMGARAKLGHMSRHQKDDFQNQKATAEAKNKSTITARSFDHQVAEKMGEFFEETLLPAMKTFVSAGLSYDEVKRLLKIPTTWGAKIRGEQFAERASRFRRQSGKSIR